MRQQFSILLLIISFTVSAQQDSSKVIYDITPRFLYSSIWTGRGSLQQFTKDHPWAIQVDLGILKNTQRAFNYCNCYSRNGISIGYINFANRAQLGNAFTVSVFAEPFLILRKRFSFSLRGSTGFAFLNKLYDSLTNKESIFFSTKVSYYLAMGLSASYQLNKKLKLSVSGQLNHISNGGKKDPNEGLNFPSVNLGLSYVINPQTLERRLTKKFTDKTYGIIVHVFGTQRVAPATALWSEE